MADSTKRYAVVTGSNKGLGCGIVKELATKGITVVLTARDVKKGLEAIEKLRVCGLSDHVVFHQLDVMDSASIANLADFLKTHFGKLDILVNNAGVGGTILDTNALAASKLSNTEEDVQNVWSKVLIQNYELAKECIDTNYYGVKATTEALLPLLQLSEYPRIVNISSGMAVLKYIPNEWAKGVLNDVDSLSDEKIDDILNVFLRDFQDGSLEAKKWPTFLSAYILSKAAVNAHTRMLAKNLPNFCINCINPGFVKTDMNNNTGTSSVEEAAVSPVKLALLPNGGPSGLFYTLDEISSFSE